MDRAAVAMKAIQIAFISLSIFLICAGSAIASQSYGDILVSVESSPSDVSFHGYAEIRIVVTNKSVDKAHRITLFTPHESRGYGDHLSRITRSVVLRPSSMASVAIFQPPLRIDGSGLGVIIDGATQREPVRLDTFWHCRQNYYAGGAAFAPMSILLSRSVNIGDFQSAIDTTFPENSAPYSPGSVHRPWQFIKSEAPASAWSNNWLAYSRYDGIVLTAADMQAMPAAVSSALLQYVQCGGSLLVIGQWDMPAAWKSEETALGPLRFHYIHFGVCAVSETPDFKPWERAVWEKLIQDAWRPTALEAQKRMTIADANTDFPVVKLTMPVRGMFGLVLLFAITIGPVNLLMLSRKRKMIWMLWIVPAVSIAASAGVFLYAFLAYGWREQLRSQMITCLDEKADSATTSGICAFYCPLTPRGGLHFDYETEVTPMGLEERRGGRARTVDWTNGQHLGVGWVTARVPAHFLLRKSQVRRERIEITKTRDNGFSALNGLGADIQELWYADSDGRIYKAEKIAAGTKAVLTPSPDSVPSDVRPEIWRATYGMDWVSGSNTIIQNPEKHLRANSYIAVLDDLVFVEQPLRNVKTENSKSVVFGIL